MAKNKRKIKKANHGKRPTMSHTRRKRVNKVKT